MNWLFDAILELGGLRGEEKVHRATSRVWPALLIVLVLMMVVVAAAG